MIGWVCVDVSSNHVGVIVLEVVVSQSKCGGGNVALTLDGNRSYDKLI